MSILKKALDRRTFLAAVPAGAIAGGAGSLALPASAGLLRAGRPALTHGVQAGDVGTSTATVWARANRPARLMVEVSGRPDFRGARRIPGAVVTPEHDFTGKTVLSHLPAGQELHYRVTPVDLHDTSLAGAPLRGTLRTVPRGRRDVSFLWAGDLGGQGWGIDPARGGYQIFEVMRRLNADFYICNGDNIYADDPFEAEVTLADGSIWRNIVTAEKAKAAETLDEYRGNYKYNLLDENLKRFYASIAQIQQWDDHETHNNWYPGEILDDPNYAEKRTDVLKYRSRQAWHEYMPIAPEYDEEGRIYRVLHHGPLLDVFVLDMRWYRDANSADKQKFNEGGILGRKQAEWLKRELAASTATWKVISNDMPLGIVVPDTPNFEAVSQGDPGKPLGREIQIADILSFLKREDIRNVVWLTTDVHYTQALHFHPDRAAFKDFNPFWQFVSGPLNAGSGPADALDATFGPSSEFLKAPATTDEGTPAGEYQFFGQISIDAASRELTVRLHDKTGTVLWRKNLTPYRR